MEPEAIARDLEALAARDREVLAGVAARLFPGAGVAVEHIGGAVAVSGGEAIGVSSIDGLDPTRPLSAEESSRVRAFLDRAGSGRVEVSIPADSSAGLRIGLEALGLVHAEFEDVFVMPLDDRDAVSAPSASGDAGAIAGYEIGEAGPADAETWARLVATAFSDGHEPPEVDLRFARAMVRVPHVRLFWALRGSEPVAAGELRTSGGIAWLSADGTLPAHRGRGLQAALQSARIEAGRLAGCTLAVTEAAPGTASHRNAVRSGFRPAYRRLLLSRSPR